MRIILASQSPMRKELLKQMGLEFEVIVSNADETFEEGLSLEEQSKRLAYIKAKTVFEETSGDRIVIGSDTIVVKNNKIYGKPKNHDEAIAMLKELENDKHEVMTGLSVMYEKDGKVNEILDVSITSVYISEVTDSELENWIATNEAYDKAGGYAIQGKFGVFIDKIEGDYFTVVGLPLHKLYEAIKNLI